VVVTDEQAFGVEADLPADEDDPGTPGDGDVAIGGRLV